MPKWLDHETVKLMLRQLLVEWLLRHDGNSHQPPIATVVTNFLTKVMLISDTRAKYRQSKAHLQHHFDEQDFEIELEAHQIAGRSVAAVKERCQKVEERIARLKKVPMKIEPSSLQKAEADFRRYLDDIGADESEEDKRTEWAYTCAKYGIQVPAAELPPIPSASFPKQQAELANVDESTNGDSEKRIRMGNDPAGQPHPG